MAQIGIREVTLASEVAAALARSACVGLLAVCVGLLLSSFLSRIAKPFRWVVWTLLLSPFVIPTLLVGYHYANVSHEPWEKEFLYGGLLFLKLSPIAALVLFFSPRSLSAQAAHCLRLSASNGSRLKRLAQECGIWLLARGRAAMIAFVVVMLFAFADFELSALLWTENWTVMIFDAQIGGISLGESFCWIARPLFAQALIVAGLFVLLTRQRFEAFQPRSVATLPRVSVAMLSWTYLLTAFVVGAGIPTWVILREAIEGWSVLEAHLAFRNEIGAGLLFALTGSLAAYWAARKLTATTTTAQRARLIVACLPGLAGALTLSLCVLALFQLPIFRERFFDPMRLPFAFALLLMPFAVLLNLALRVTRPASASRLAELMKAGGTDLRQRAGVLLWHLERRKHFWAVALLFFWAYYDLTASSLLAPVDMPTAMARLYNLTHYGHSDGLSALILVTVLAPIALAFAVAGARGIWARWRYA